MTGLLRPYTVTDRAAIGEVCLRTGAAGGDARGLYRDSSLLPDVFAYPYVDLEPETAFVVVHPTATGAPADDVLRVEDGTLVGYVLACADTAAFVERWRREWAPGFRARHPEPAPAPPTGGPAYPETTLWRDGLNPDRMLGPGPSVLEHYPAHLHIDLLPAGQGQGWGRRLIDALVTALAARGVPGVHLGFDPANTNAAGFYQHLGFVPPPGDPASTFLRVLPIGS
jgi:ribosomal protein S18 acetylase RimI-like enzyme